MTAFVWRNVRTGCFCVFFLWVFLNTGIAQTAGAGLNFDGVNDFVKVATLFNSYGKELTLECWVNITYATRGSGIGQGLDGVDSYVWLLHGLPAGNGFRFYVNLFPCAQVSSDIVIASGWHHIACTVGSQSLKFYVDGVLVNTVNITNNGIRNNISSVVVLGRDLLFLTGRFYNGAMDEVRIWNRELCQSEIQYNMNTEIDPTHRNFTC